MVLLLCSCPFSLPAVRTGHPATLYYNIGLVYDFQGDYAKALECFNKALLMLEKSLGEDHPYTQIVTGNIETIRQRMQSQASE